MESLSGGGPANDLDALLVRVRACRICRDTPSGPPLAHQPRPVLRARADARLCIAGQAPGTLVHASGVPFDDPSGRRLRTWLGMDEATFYDQRRVAIVPMGFCFPGQDGRGADRPPRRECAPAWRQAVMDHLPAVQLILAVGGYAQAWHLGTRKSDTLTETVAAWRTIARRSGRPQVVPLPHPSWRNNGWLKRNPWFEIDLLPALRERIATILSEY
ncbi:MAG: uracil-DNA glycosylase family protein [Alphaproteobacteria bacterium]